jgi:hypothetical protein
MSSCEGLTSVRLTRCPAPVRPGYRTCVAHNSQESAARALYQATVARAAALDHLKGMARATIEAELKAEGRRMIVSCDDNRVIASTGEAAIKEAFGVEEIREWGGDAHLQYGYCGFDEQKGYNVLFLDTTPDAALMFAREGLAASASRVEESMNN